jgi:hypothetical protein
MNVCKVGAMNTAVPQKTAFKSDLAAAEPEVKEKKKHTGRNLTIGALVLAAIGTVIYIKNRGKGEVPEVPPDVKKSVTDEVKSGLSSIIGSVKKAAEAKDAKAKENAKIVYNDFSSKFTSDQYVKNIEEKHSAMEKRISKKGHAKRLYDLEQMTEVKPVKYVAYNKVRIDNGMVLPNKKVINNGDKTIITKWFYDWQMPNNGG